MNFFVATLADTFGGRAASCLRNILVGRYGRITLVEKMRKFCG